MNLEQLRPKPQDLLIRLPDGKNGWKDGTDTGIVLQLVSADGPLFHNLVSKQAQEDIGRDATTVPIAERQQRTAAQVATCITGWTNIDDYDYTPEKAVSLMLNPELAFIREQVEAYAVKRANFFRKNTNAAVQLHPTVDKT